MSYSLGYLNIHTPPMTTVSRATGYDLWLHPYFNQSRYFFMYCLNLRGEIRPFGDGEQGAVGSGAGMSSLLFFHGNQYNDPAAVWYARQFSDKDGNPPEVTWRPAIFVEDKVQPAKPENLSNDRLFRGIGWAAFHSDLAAPENDVHVMFKSSPYGSVSHAYADQNTFTIMKGGQALASVSGHYWPTYGAPFHAEYTRHTISKNAILVNGQGQIVRQRSASGEIVDFRSTDAFGYACGDAVPAYGGLLNRARRHILLIRPNVVVVVDDLEAPEAADYQWLFQTRQQFADMNEASQTFVSERGGHTMKVHLATPGGFSFHQTDDWPVEPTKGYEDKMDERGGRIPPKHWHFTGSTREKTRARRIAAIMTIDENGVMPEAALEREGDLLKARVPMAGATAMVTVDLGTGKAGEAPILEVEYRADSGKRERLSVK